MNSRILVVDDEPHIRHLLRRQMEQSGYAVEEAQNGAEAIKLLERESFDLVIADIVMPERDGLEVIMFIKQEQPDIKIIAISAPGNHLFLDIAKGLGATRVFGKPFVVSDIERAAEELLATP